MDGRNPEDNTSDVANEVDVVEEMVNNAQYFVDCGLDKDTLGVDDTDVDQSRDLYIRWVVVRRCTNYCFDPVDSKSA